MQNYYKKYIKYKKKYLNLIDGSSPNQIEINYISGK